MFWYIYGIVVVVAHVPIMIDMLRFSFPNLKLSRVGHGSRFILMAVAAIIGVTVLWQLLCVFLPLYSPSPFTSISGLLQITFAFWAWINAVVNYYMALLVHPGVDKASTVESVKHSEENTFYSSGSDVRNRNSDQLNGSYADGISSSPQSFNVREIKTNNGMLWSPTRSNLCKICKYRVAFVDHHCPYTGGCFGLYNYSYFYIGLWYGMMGAVYALILTAPCFWECDVKYFLSYLNILDSSSLEVDMCEKIGTQSRAFIPVVGGMWAVGMMLLAQTLLLLADVSTFNVLKNTTRVPILRFIGQRIRGRKFLQPDSRLNILVLSQRARWYHYLIPVRNVQSSGSHKSQTLLI